MGRKVNRKKGRKNEDKKAKKARIELKGNKKQQIRKMGRKKGSEGSKQ